MNMLAHSPDTFVTADVETRMATAAEDNGPPKYKAPEDIADRLPGELRMQTFLLAHQFKRRGQHDAHYLAWLGRVF